MDPAMVASRIFIGSLPYDTTKEELEMIYGKYGKIIGLTILKGFAFLQYEKEEHAKAAVAGERGSSLRGFVLDVKLATEGKRKPGEVSGKGDEKDHTSPPRSVDMMGYRPPMPRGPPPPGHPYGPPPGPFFRPPMPGPPFPPGPLPPPEHFRRHPFDPYCEPFPPIPGFGPHPPPPRPPPAPTVECEILVLEDKQRPYADSIKKRLMAVGIVTEMNILAPDVDIMVALEEATVRRLLFAIVINEQNEVHRSITVNILHGLAQEHRNMPVDDAITLITRSYDKYMLERKERAEAGFPPGLPPPGGPPIPELNFLPASPRVQYLLNLLADQRFLTAAELTTVIEYLVDRRHEMAPVREHSTRSQSQERRDIRSERDMGPPPMESRRMDPPMDVRGNRGYDDDNRRMTYAAPPCRDPEGFDGRRNSESMPAPVPAASSPSQNPSLAHMINTSINFDNPTVKQALDNLIQSGPNLFRGISDNAPRP